jgi:putative ABC transport system substrate-binding protein
MKRREFITLLGGAAVGWPTVARAQQPAIPVIGFLNSRAPSENPAILAAFRRGFEEAGYVEGRNVAVEYRWADGQYDRLPALAADLVGRQVAAIVANGPAVQTAKSATSALPIVFVVGFDPLAFGLVDSLSRPGGNLTGVSVLDVEIGAKRLELLHELVPTATIIALLVNPTTPAAETVTREAQAAARGLGLQLHVLHASSDRDFDTVFATVAQLRAGALVIVADPFFTSRSQQLAKLTVDHAVPAIYEFREFAAAGGLISYGTSIVDAYRRLHRPYPQRRKAFRPAGTAGDESRTDPKPQDSQGARYCRSIATGWPRRRSDGISSKLLQRQWSHVGPKLSCEQRRPMSGIEGWNGLVVDKPLGRKEHAIAAFLHADLVRQMFFVEAARGRERKHIDSDEVAVGSRLDESLDGCRHGCIGCLA